MLFPLSNAVLHTTYDLLLKVKFAIYVFSSFILASLSFLSYRDPPKSQGLRVLGEGAAAAFRVHQKPQ
jgi:hypothetical protein